MKIALVRREALDVPDGINIFLFSLADALISAGHEVVMVATFGHDIRKIQEYYKLEHWPETVALTSDNNVRYSRALITWLTVGKSTMAALNPDFVLINGAVPLSLPGLTCTVSHDAEQRLSRVPIMRSLFKHYSYRQSDLVCATCDEVRKALGSEAGIDPLSIAVIPTCVKLDAYINKPFEEREDAILHIGTVDYKNPNASIAAFRHVASSGRRLYITGTVDQRLKDVIARLDTGVRERIDLLGYVSAARLIELLGSVKIVSVPSVYSVPVASPTVIESFASGTPVVSTSSISRDVLKNGSNGYVCDPANDREIAAAFEQLLSDANAWKRMADNARQSAQRFCSHRVANMYLDAYRNYMPDSASVGQPVAKID